MLSSSNKQLFPGRHGEHGYYDPVFIKTVVQEIESGLPLQTAVITYRLKKGTVREWMDKYGSPAYKKTLRKPVSAPIKRSIVRAILDKRMTIREAAVAYKVNRWSIGDWVRAATSENADIASNNLAALKKEKSTPLPEAPPLPEDIQLLQQQLAEERLKNAALNTLIDVAEEQLKINIRKKPGARQS